MSILNPLKIAYKAIKLHKVRSGLTILGLMIGVVSIIIVINLGSGIKTFILNEVSVFGSDYVQIEVKVPSTSKNGSDNAMGMASGITITTLKFEDAKEIGKHPNIKDYYAGIVGQDIASRDGEHKTTMIWGVNASFFNLFNAKIEKGRPFDEGEDSSQDLVVVIGSELSKKLFGQEEAVGRKIKIGKKSFQVVGVMEKQGSTFFMDMDNATFMPAKTLQKKVMGVDHIQFITAYLKNPSKAKETASDIESIMRSQHKITDPNKDDFAVTTMEEAMGMIETITGGITLLLAAIAAISLLVGGVGIMNIMYVSVAERTYEIGLRKAIGATNSNILWQFIWEAILLTTLGGIIGVITGEALSATAMFAINKYGINWGYTFSNFGIFLGVGFSVATGLIFGIYPAKQASQMEPIEALQKQ